MAQLTTVAILVALLLGEILVIRKWPFRIAPESRRLIITTLIASKVVCLGGFILVLLLPEKTLGLATMFASYGYLALIPRNTAAHSGNNHDKAGQQVS